MPANDKQIGGAHYGRGDYQHWDWVCETHMHYLPAAASKYVVRWREKNGEEDLKKSIHYIDKAEEMHITGSPAPTRMAAFWRFVLENKLPMVEAMICWYLQEGEWEAAKLAMQELAQSVAE